MEIIEELGCHGACAWELSQMLRDGHKGKRRANAIDILHQCNTAGEGFISHTFKAHEMCVFHF
jgi:hypothetical protein